MLRSAVFMLGLGVLFTHELNAMQHAEWRVLPLLRALDDDLGRDLFVLLHIPLFAGIVAAVASTAAKLRTRSRLVVAAFLVIHGGLHFLYTDHAAYTFSGPIANGLIYGGAVCGAVYLLLERIKKAPAQR
ncbi:MAG: DUF6713 family protein [Pseudomonadota bacterium]